MKKVSGKLLLFIAGTALLATGCNTVKNANNKQKGAAAGAAGGAVIGGIIGNNVGNGKNTALGAIIGAVVGGVTGGIIGNKMDKQAQKIEEEVPGAEVTRVGEGINVTFNENNPDGSKAGVYFATNKSDINENSKAALDKLVKIFNEYPETNILIEGHTDDVGTDAYNETLSEKRAKAVGMYLTDANIAPSRITVKWYGEKQPKVENNSDANRALNRRVELAITANEKMKQEAAAEAAKQ